VAVEPVVESRGPQTMSFSRIIDLSTGLIEGAPHEPTPAIIERRSHEHGARWMVDAFGLEGTDALVVSGGLGPASELVTTVTHAGTHVDAPWHYHPTSEGLPSKTIEECPVEWFFSDGVVLDLRHKAPGELIHSADLRAALEAVDYALKPLDIVMLMTGTDKRLGSPAYFEQPGMTREATLWLVDQGIKVIGVDMYGFDRRFSDMAAAYASDGDGAKIWEAHFAGIEREYCQIEKLVNLDLIPRAHGFKVAAFPIKIEGGSGGWCRAVAFV
jgi:kynurenine formamidase